MSNISKEEQEKINEWLKQFIKSIDHDWPNGFYYVLHTGETLYPGTAEYENWYKEKIKGYKQD